MPPFLPVPTAFKIPESVESRLANYAAPDCQLQCSHPTIGVHVKIAFHQVQSGEQLALMKLGTVPVLLQM